MRFGSVALAFFAVGCVQPAPPQPATEDSDRLAQVVERLDAIDRRITALEGNSPPPSEPLGRWQRLSHDAGVGSARLRGAIYREAVEREWESPRELADWLRSQIEEREPKVFATIKAALAVEFKDGWDPQRQNEILRELAEGYDTVK